MDLDDARTYGLVEQATYLEAAEAGLDIPVGRFGQPEEVASLIAYLCSDMAAMITGSNVLIDGGFTTI